MKLLTNVQQESYEMQKPVSYICEEKIEDKYFKDEKYRKVRDHCQYIEQYRHALHNICNLRDIV